MRVDPAADHSYPRVSRVEAGEPECPYALHLTNADHEYEFVVFDLDVSRGGQAAVWRDADTITTLLAEHGLEHLVSRSGPGGGIHVWVPVSGDGLEADVVARLARAAALRLPTLDITPLTTPSTGAVRPPGAPHRTGGRAELLHPVDLDEALMVCDTDSNTLSRFEALAEAFGATELDTEEAAAAAVAAERVDPVEVRLHGRRSPMPDMVRHLLDSAPDDPSAHLARILPRLALARWSLADVRRMVANDPTAPGLEHLRTRSFGSRRVRRTESDFTARLTRKWRKAVEFAARLAPGVERAERDLLALRGIGAAVLEAVGEHPELWTEEAGPADRSTLVGVLHTALKASAQDGEVDVDIRRLALATGLGKSTVARALQRLRRDGRLVQTAEAEGTLAARWRLVHPDHWAGVAAGETGGTQGNPAPPVHPAPGVHLESVEDLLHRTTSYLEAVAHEVFAEHSPTHPRGLGRHVARTYAALVETAPHLYTVDTQALAHRTGHSEARTARHLRILAEHGLIDSHTGLPTDTAALDAAAAHLGTTGVHAARERRYEAERAAHAAWQAEMARLRAPVALRPCTRSADRYARTSDRRPDHGAQIARHLAAAA
ncbi:hypothetical protein [Nocardiopsis sp. NPDC006938]|uniref:hypothetical protein n=1 Tax=Nocardiopsis sp. NPDC006938 TaxID=3364337 RepID=UPI0036BD75B0